jgi:uncharacterized protein
MAKKVIGFSTIMIILIGAYFFLEPKDSLAPVVPSIPSAQFEQKSITIGNVQVAAYIADTPAKQEQGLMHVEALHENEGMLFMFDTVNLQSFWNKNTLLDLDIIWIAGETIVGVSSLPNEPSNGTNTVSSPAPVDKVLEMPMGWVAVHGVGPGTKVNIED